MHPSILLDEKIWVYKSVGIALTFQHFHHLKTNKQIFALRGRFHTIFITVVHYVWTTCQYILLWQKCPIFDGRGKQFDIQLQSHRCSAERQVSIKAGEIYSSEGIGSAPCVRRGFFLQLAAMQSHLPPRLFPLSCPQCRKLILELSHAQLHPQEDSGIFLIFFGGWVGEIGSLFIREY